RAAGAVRRRSVSAAPELPGARVGLPFEQRLQCGKGLVEPTLQVAGQQRFSDCKEPTRLYREVRCQSRAVRSGLECERSLLDRAGAADGAACVLPVRFILGHLTAGLRLDAHELKDFANACADAYWLFWQLLTPLQPATGLPLAVISGVSGKREHL